MFIRIDGAQHSSRCSGAHHRLLDAPALPLDLPGRGQHPAPLDQVHLNDFIESAVEDIETAEAHDAVLVGHSMAGLSIASIVDRVHDRLRHIAFLSCMIPSDGESIVSTLPPEHAKLAELAVPDPAGVSRARR